MPSMAVAGLLAWKDLGDYSPLRIHAGTASWRFAGDEDTEGPTHFTYQWDSDAAMLGQLFGQGPEWHVWLCSLVYRVVIDLTTGFQPLRLPEALPGSVWMDQYALHSAIAIPFDQITWERYLYCQENEAIELAYKGGATLLSDAGYSKEEILSIFNL